ncbi:hypothetical protein M3231_15445 [Neobacillus mesonae]|nr:hypothetical protein [Neobacillus mesonae]
MVRVGKPMAPNTFVIYVANKVVEIVHAESRAQASAWATRNFGDQAYVFENAQARDIAWEERYL